MWLRRIYESEKSPCEVYELIKKKHFVLEGIYTHIYNPTDKIDTFKKQVDFINGIIKYLSH